MPRQPTRPACRWPARHRGLAWPLGAVLCTGLVAATPVAHWNFDGLPGAARLAESYGTAALNASEVGSNSWSTRSGFGDVLANGTNLPYLSVPNTGALDFGTGDFAISLWIRRTSNSGSAAGILDALDNTGTGFQLLFPNTDQVRLRLDDHAGNSAICDVGTPHLHLDAWQHLAINIDRTNDRVHFHINGTIDDPAGVDITALTGSITPDQELWIGTLNATTPAYGQLDDLAFFDRLLTPAEIAALNADGGTPVLTVFPPAATAPAVTIDPVGGAIRPGDTVTLTTGPGFAIRYTLDGTDPDGSSPLYSPPLTITASGALRARASDGTGLGPVASADFFVLPADPPNIVLIVGDDLGFNDLGCFGAVTAATPRLDALAAAGCRHPQFTTTGPGDLASQYALLTGRLPRRAGLPESLTPGTPGLDSREWTLAEALRKAGYDTAFIGAWHLGDTPGSVANDQGFMLFHGLPAAPALAPLSENGAVLDADPDPATLLETFTARAESFLATRTAAPFLLVFQAPRLPAAGTSLLGDYGNQVEALDTAAGRILDQLDTLGLADDTLVVFLSDEGADRNTGGFPTGSNGQLRDGKGTTWEGGVRTPCITRWPGVIPAATTSFQPLWLPDLHASLAALADGYLADDRPLDGSGRLTALLGRATAPDPAATLFLHRHTGGTWQLRAVRQGQWKLHQSYNNSDPENTVSAAAPLLYDLLVDPTERIDRRSEQPALVTTLQAAAAAHEAGFGTPAPQLPPARPPFLDVPAIEFVAGPGPGRLHYTYRRPADALDDHYRVQHSGNLVDWDELPTQPFVGSVTTHPDRSETVELAIPLEHPAFTGPERFIRLKAVRP